MKKKSFSSCIYCGFKEFETVDEEEVSKYWKFKLYIKQYYHFF